MPSFNCLETFLLTCFTFKHYETVRQPAANGHHTLDSQFLAASTHLPDDHVPMVNHDAMEHQDSQDSTITTSSQPQMPVIIEPSASQPDQRSVSPMPPPVTNTAAAETAPEPPVGETTELATAYSYAQPPPAPPPVPEPIIITRENPINEELYAKYNKALIDLENMQALVVELRQLCKQAEEAAAANAQEQELRRRTRRLSNADSAAPSEAVTMVDDAPIHQEGVPLNVVVMIALGVFVTTYLFF